MKMFLLVFIPLFVAIDPMGILPFFVSLTEGYSKQEKRRLAYESVATALVVGLAFAAAGHVIFKMLGITSSDFEIAGGLLLLIFSVQQTFGQTTKMTDGTPHDALVGIVPLGIPVIAGPAMITTLLILYDSYSLLLIIPALLVTLGITLGLFLYSDQITRAVGPAVSRAVAKVVAIFLAAIGIMMIRRGVQGLWHPW